MWCDKRRAGLAAPREGAVLPCSPSWISPGQATTHTTQRVGAWPRSSAPSTSCPLRPSRVVGTRARASSPHAGTGRRPSPDRVASITSSWTVSRDAGPIPTRPGAAAESAHRAVVAEASGRDDQPQVVDDAAAGEGRPPSGCSVTCGASWALGAPRPGVRTARSRHPDGVRESCGAVSATATPVTPRSAADS